MEKLKLVTILGTRPEIIRLSEILRKCDRYFQHVLVHTGQNWDDTLNKIFFEDLGLRPPDHMLEAVGEDLGDTIGRIIARSYAILSEIRPDALLVLGDTNSALSAIAAKRLKIPIFHMEAGNRCYDENLPEETNRRIVDHIADVNLCYSEQARRYLLAEGRPKERTFVVGSPMAEVIEANMERINGSRVLEMLKEAGIAGAVPGGYILLSAHREENIDAEKPFLSLMSAVNAMAERWRMPVIYSTHPRSAKFIEGRQFAFHPQVYRCQPFSFTDYMHLQTHAFCVVSDSGTLPEEAAYCHFPAVSIRTSTERPESLEKGNFVLGGITEEEVLQAVEMATAMKEARDEGESVPDYRGTNVSGKVVRIIQGYTRIVDRLVWRKQGG